MELEAENWWLHGTGHDFDAKKKFIGKYLFFLIENFFTEKFSFFCVIFFDFFENFIEGL